MLKKLFLLIMVFVFALSPVVSAKSNSYHSNNSYRSSYHQKNWHEVKYTKIAKFSWHKSHNQFYSRRYKMERLHNDEWYHRFPGLHAYEWNDRRGEGFLYNGRRITKAVLFYNKFDQLVRVGFMHNGNFIVIHDDHRSYQNRDSFFVAWSNR